MPTPVYKQSLGPCTMNHAQVTDSRLSHKHLPTAGAGFGVILGGGGYDFRYFVRSIRPLHSIYRCASFLLRFIRLWSGGRRTQLQWSADGASKREWPNVEVTQPILHCQEASSAPSSLTIKCHECLRWTAQQQPGERESMASGKGSAATSTYSGFISTSCEPNSFIFDP